MTTPPDPNASPSRGQAPPPHPRSIARRLGLSFAQIVVLSTVVCVLLLILLARVTGYVHEMQHQEHAIDAGVMLTGAVREQHIQAAGRATGDPLRYERARERVARSLEATGAHAPASARWRLDRIRQNTVDADRVLRGELDAALGRGDVPRRGAALELINGLLEAAEADADVLAGAATARMAHAHVDTTRVSTIASAVAGIGIVLLVLLAAWSTRRLRAAVLRPIGALVDAARRIGQGDFKARVGLAAEGELGVVSTAFDRMAEELVEHERRLVTTERMAAIGQLAAGVAHEINNPIGVIRGYLRTMIPDATHAELKDELRILDEEAAACQRIAEDLVAYARSPDIARQTVDLEELCRQVAERFEASGESKSCRVRTAVAPCMATVDPVRIRQVLVNLLRNAVQATSGEGIVELSGEASGSSCVLRVRDSGAGIAPELRGRIFEPFVSGKSAGTGLGLAVCQGIVRAHGGTIEATDRPGGGSEFTITLPMENAAPAGERHHG